MPHISIESLHLPSALTYVISFPPSSNLWVLIRSNLNSSPIAVLTLAWLVSCLPLTFPEQSLQPLIPSQRAFSFTFNSIDPAALPLKMLQPPSASLWKPGGNASGPEILVSKDNLRTIPPFLASLYLVCTWTHYAVSSCSWGMTHC